ncbi:MAG: DUF4129 domain-containing protein [Desulfurococcales archaeon]|nr:DUF4129 domain-containing protein [Desulfurococcales archaeon]
MRGRKAIARVAACALLALVLLASMPTASASEPRHPEIIGNVLPVFTFNSSSVLKAILSTAQALASDAAMMTLDFYNATLTLNERSGVLVLRGDPAIPYAPRPNALGAGNASAHLEAVPGIVIRGRYYLDYLTVESLLLDAATAVARRDFHSYLMVSATAASLLGLLNSSAHPSAPATYVAVPMLEVRAAGNCSKALVDAARLLVSQGESPSMDALEGSVGSRPYAIYPTGGPQGPPVAYIINGYEVIPPCYAVLNYTIVQVTSTYVSAYESLEAYALLLLASIQPLSARMERFISIRASSATPLVIGNASSTSLRKPGAAYPGEGGLFPSLNTSYTRILREIARRVAPSPSGMAALISRSARESPGGEVNLGEILSALSAGSAGFSSNLRLPTIRVPNAPLRAPALSGSTLGSSLARLLLLSGFIALLAAVAIREGLHRSVRRSLRRLYEEVIAAVYRTAYSRGPRGPLRCYLYALSVSSRLARPKKPSETPREYLAGVASRLPYKARKLLEAATRAYEAYRYAGREVGVPEDCRWDRSEA